MGLPAPKGLRERKKAQTRAAIQRHALHLFQRDGYGATTMEQIAAAADVSPSTLYRYFPTKEDLVLQDDYDPMIVAAFRAQPPEMPVLEAFQAALLDVMSVIGEEGRAEAMARLRLTYTIPEVRARALDHLLMTTDMLAELFGEHLGRAADELEVRVLVGMAIGAMLGAHQVWIADPDADLIRTTDEAMQVLIDGPGRLARSRHR
jgi:AcrR family transcriptional regulator